MNSHRIALIIVTAIALLAIAQNAWYWGKLPDRVATHFNLEGTPDGWMNKTNALIVMCGFQVCMPYFLMAITMLSSRLPASMVNIPHREYWLHPDRRVTTMRYVQSIMNWIAVLFSLFAMAISHLVFVANRDSDGLDTVWFATLMTVFLASVFSLVAILVRRFRLPHNMPQSK